MIETDWITDADPVNPGVYKRKHPDGQVFFHLWNGSSWMGADNTSEGAARVKVYSLFTERLPWRGIVPEVHGCVQVEAPDPKYCRGCAFDPPDGGVTRRCIAANRAASCLSNGIIWRPRSEVAA